MKKIWSNTNKKHLLIILCLIYIPIFILTFISTFIYGGFINLSRANLYIYNNIISFIILISLFAVNFFYLAFIIKIFISVKIKALTIKEISILKYKKTLIILSLLIGFLIISISIWAHIEIYKVIEKI